MITRRRLGGLAVGALGAASGMASGIGAAGAAEHRYEPLVVEEGFYTWDWFLSSFLELADDLETSTSNGKRLILMWELDGCPYCREMHVVNIATPLIHDYIRDHFDVLQLDLYGGREVVDFDGTVMTERELARRNNIRYTPTIQFLPESITDMTGRTGKDIEVARMPGYLEPLYFFMYFQYVQEKAYGAGDFRAYLKSRLSAVKDGGRPLPNL